VDLKGPPRATGEGDDRIARQAESFDEALAEGRTPPEGPAGETDGESTLLAAQASLRMLERVWPRSRTTGETVIETALIPPVAGVFGRFRIVRELGRGGFGIVFLAIDPELNRPVALKVPRGEVLLDPDPRRRFVREARALACLDHPSIVPLYEAGEVGPVCYIASAYCEGPTLAVWLRDRREPVPPRLAARLLAPLADAMQQAHDRGILHRDLKPSNVLLHHPSPDWGGPANGHPPALGPLDVPQFTPRIIDFGLARLMDLGSEDATASFAAMGSAPYMAPEQAEGGKLGPATDVYGLGTILYSLLCQRPPHRGTSAPDTLRRVVSEDPIPPRRDRRDVPRDLEAICLKCLAKDPARRYRTAGELADDLGRFLAREPTVARPQAPWENAARIARRHAAALAMLVLVASALGVILARRPGDDTPHGAARNRPHGRQQESGLREPAGLAHRRYIGDIRKADHLIRTFRGPLAREVLLRHRPRPGEEDLRDFAWYHLLSRCSTERRTLSGHRGDVHHVEFSPRGDLVAGAGKDGNVLIWSTDSGQVVHSFEASDTELNAATFSPDGAWLATADDKGKLRSGNWTAPVASGKSGRTRERPAPPGSPGTARRSSPRGGRTGWSSSGTARPAPCWGV
jgi:serine/threonine protein kinase